MKKLCILLAVVLVCGIQSQAQEQSTKELRETARTFMMQGDYANAVGVLNKALESDKENLELLKDLAFTHYLNRNYSKALEIARPLGDRADADIQTYQILGMIYNDIEEKKDAEKMFRAAFKKFPASGVLHKGYGDLLWSRKMFKDAARYWEKGIEIEPNFSDNYYNLAKYYLSSDEKIWGLIYGEMFVNLESYSKRTPEMKALLLEGYKNLFAGNDLSSVQTTKNEFLKAFAETLNKQAKVVSAGVTPESLSALRTRFILDWYQKDAARFPFKLFEYHQQLLKAGLFEAYNQWIFGAAKDLAVYQNWTTTHSEEYGKFKYFQENRVFKVPNAQYYSQQPK